MSRIYYFIKKNIYSLINPPREILSIGAFLAQPHIKHANVSLLILDARTGNAVLEHRSDKGTSPASNMKILTTATALEILGPTFCFPTYIESDGKINEHGQSKYQLAVSGIDAFAQGIESFWSLNATENSLEYSEKAIKLMWENIYNAVNGHEDALVKVAEGSNWAGKAINISKTTAPHALSYYVTKEFNLPHGHAVALFLPYFFTYNFYLNSEKCLSNVKITNEDILIKLMQLLAVKDRCFIEKKIKDFVAQLGIENDFEKLNISKKEVIKILESANPERLKNNPRLFNVKNFIDETMILSY